MTDVTQNIEFVFHTVENIVGKGENAGFQHFLLFTQYVVKDIFGGDVKSRHCLVKNIITVSVLIYGPMFFHTVVKSARRYPKS